MVEKPTSEKLGQAVQEMATMGMTRVVQVQVPVQMEMMMTTMRATMDEKESEEEAPKMSNDESRRWLIAIEEKSSIGKRWKT